MSNVIIIIFHPHPTSRPGLPPRTQSIYTEFLAVAIYYLLLVCLFVTLFKYKSILHISSSPSLFSICRLLSSSSRRRRRRSSSSSSSSSSTNEPKQQSLENKTFEFEFVCSLSLSLSLSPSSSSSSSSSLSVITVMGVRSDYMACSYTLHA